MSIHIHIHIITHQSIYQSITGPAPAQLSQSSRSLISTIYSRRPRQHNSRILPINSQRLRMILNERSLLLDLLVQQYRANSHVNDQR